MKNAVQQLIDLQGSQKMNLSFVQESWNRTANVLIMINTDT